MRIGYSDEEDFPGQFELWQANCQRSLAGAKGQAALKELEAALLALPDKRLIVEQLQDEEGAVCSIGAVVKQRGLSQNDLVSDPDEMEEVGVELGMPRLTAWKIVEMNDIYWDFVTPEVRYSKMLTWVQSQIAR